VSGADFSEQGVLDDARRAAGLSDFGDEGFREGLRVLLETYEKTAGFTPQGRRRNRRRVVQLLATRLRVEAAFRRHPEIRQRQIRRPLVLTGLPRSGTSALFNLLAADPAARPLRLWEAVFPDPMEGLAPGQPDPRRAALDAHYARAREKNPEFTKIHFTSADTPEECVLLLSHDFCDVQMGIEVMMEPYASWFRRQDFRRSYRYYHDLLRMLDWQRPGERWLLKAPAHMWALDALVESFPDVCVVWTHRNPVQCVASVASLTAALMAGREAVPVGSASRIYRHFGLDLGPDVVAALRTHAEANPQGRHGVHRYELEEYGLTQDLVRARFADYTARFGLPTD
jgi:hypothetical protein